MWRALKSGPWFSLLVLGLLAALTWWLSQLVQPHVPLADGHERHDPDYTVDGFVATAMDKNGKPQYVLRAKRMEHYPDTDATELIEAVVTQYTPGQPPMHVRAGRARMDQKGRQVTFLDKVELWREAGGGKPQMTLQTNLLHVWPDSKKASTDQPVQLTEGGRRVNAIGMELDQNTRRVTLLNKVRAHYAK